MVNSVSKYPNIFKWIVAVFVATSLSGAALYGLTAIAQWSSPLPAEHRSHAVGAIFINDSELLVVPSESADESMGLFLGTVHITALRTRLSSDEAIEVPMLLSIDVGYERRIEVSFTPHVNDADFQVATDFFNKADRVQVVAKDFGLIPLDFYADHKLGSAWQGRVIREARLVGAFLFNFVILVSILSGCVMMILFFIHGPTHDKHAAIQVCPNCGYPTAGLDVRGVCPECGRSASYK